MAFYYAASLACMVALARQCPILFGNYGDFMRLHVLLLYFFVSDTSVISNLIFVNVVGSFIATHSVYVLTEYKLLDFLMKEFFTFVVGYPTTTRWVYMIADFCVQALPLLFASDVFYIENTRPEPPFYLWFLTGVPHAMHCFFLNGGTHTTPFFGVPLQRFGFDDNNIIYISILLGHYTAFLLLYMLYILK